MEKDTVEPTEEMAIESQEDLSNTTAASETPQDSTKELEGDSSDINRATEEEEQLGNVENDKSPDPVVSEPVETEPLEETPASIVNPAGDKVDEPTVETEPSTNATEKEEPDECATETSADTPKRPKSPMAATDLSENEDPSVGSSSEVPASPPLEREPNDVAPPTLLLSLPIDSLHSIASFLFPSEWASFGLCSKTANQISGDVFRKVRLHGFRCATEVITAWKLGQHADAKELCALYVNSGVPIYPYSLGHSYHTLVWRMGIEAREMQATAEQSGEADGTDNANADTTNSDERAGGAVDQFYFDRVGARLNQTTREGLTYALTYLEEKSLFTLNAETQLNDVMNIAWSMRRQMSLAPNRFVVRPNNADFPLDDAGGLAMDPLSPSLRAARSGLSTPPADNQPGRGLTRSNSHSDLGRSSPKTEVKVHRHLLDQHLLGRPSVNDNDGMMTTPTVSLSADFFYPHFSARYDSPRQRFTIPHPTLRFDAGEGLATTPPGWLPIANAQAGIVENLDGRNGDPPMEAGAQESTLPVDGNDETDSEGDQVSQLGAISELVEPRLAPLTHAANHPTPPTSADSNLLLSPSYPSVMSNMDLEVYSASIANSKCDGDSEMRTARNHMRTRFAAYQQRLETILSQGDGSAFDECILDFWDEFFPQTANIQYYDRHSAVPRLSCMHNFLTKPCPKALGIVQCEIERIKLSSKKKGVSMKGRFFPTYEYRLFIRHRPDEALDETSPPRRDTLLMVAKNRGRKHVEASTQSYTPGKKGSNNYYLYLPKQDDVDQHYKTVNEVETIDNPTPNGAANGTDSSDRTALLGRLQSNFIGTEFQIFTPQLRKQKNLKNPPGKFATSSSGITNMASSDEEVGYDSGAISDNASSSSRRRGRFGRLSMMRSGTPSRDRGRPPQMQPEDSTPMRRSRSSGDVGDSRRTRTSRRAIANNSEGTDQHRHQPLLSEEEDGAITYTANLLGSRPRIMDVCIPIVGTDGTAGASWKKHIETNLADVDNSSRNRMLNHLKQIQQRMENEEHGRGGDQFENSLADEFGLLALQNRPPWWNPELGSYVLNFGGRVSVASVKNFQLCDRTDQEYIMLQFGRITGRHAFTMDFQYPLTAVQAFAIAISSLQSKIQFC